MEITMIEVLWSVCLFVGGILAKKWIDSFFKKSENRDAKDVELDNKFNELEKHMVKGFGNMELSMERMLSSIEKLAMSQNTESEKREAIRESLDAFKKKTYGDIDSMKKEISELRTEVELLKKK